MNVPWLNLENICNDKKLVALHEKSETSVQKSGNWKD